jgi:phosphonate transport system ATP-binding protein
MASAALVDVRRVYKTFRRGAPVCRDISFQLDRGEMVALIGASGSGKSTLIRAIAGIEAIDSAEVGFTPLRFFKSGRNRQQPMSMRNGLTPEDRAGIDLFGLPMQRDGRVTGSAKKLRVRVGVIFQQFNLVPRLSVLTNVCLGFLGHMPRRRSLLGRFTADEKRRAMQALARVGIAEHALRRGADLSGGQQQRAAIARTLVQGAEFIVADEPIASLDPASARRVMDILADLNRRDGITVLVSLHQVDYALAYCSRTIALKDGGIVYDGPSEALSPPLLRSIYGDESQEPLPAGPAEAAPRAMAGDPPPPLVASA